MAAVTPWASYAALAEQHPELIVECECRRRFHDACGCISGSCPWCDDVGRRPRELGELLETAGVRYITFNPRR